MVLAFSESESGARVRARARGVECWALATADTLYQPLWLESEQAPGAGDGSSGSVEVPPPKLDEPEMKNETRRPGSMGEVTAEARERALLALQGSGLLADEAGVDELALWPLALPPQGRCRAFGCCLMPSQADLSALVAARPESVEPVARCLAAGLAGSVVRGSGAPTGDEVDWLGVWREGPALVFGWFAGREPLHAAGVASATALADEARLALAGLELRGFDLTPRRLLVWGDALEAGQAAELARALAVGATGDQGLVADGEAAEGAAMSVRMVPGLGSASGVAPAAQPPVPGGGLVPAALAAARRGDRRQEWWLSMVTGVLAVLLLGFGIWVWQVRQVERETAGLEQQWLALAPAVAEVDAVRGLWTTMERAVDPDATPVELFHRVQQLFPAEGIRLTEFEFTPERLLVVGEASSTAHALRLRDALQDSEGLADFRWTFPPPEILEDGRATFLAEGGRG